MKLEQIKKTWSRAVQRYTDSKKDDASRIVLEASIDADASKKMRELTVTLDKLLQKLEDEEFFDKSTIDNVRENIKQDESVLMKIVKHPAYSILSSLAIPAFTYLSNPENQKKVKSVLENLGGGNNAIWFQRIH